MKQLVLLFVLVANCVSAQFSANTVDNDSIIVKRTSDFEVSGGGESTQWKAAPWNIITQRRDTANKKETKFKTLYSDKGIYFLFHNQDEILTASKNADFDSLWLEDVNEVFLWPDTSNTIYFEYEISPLNYELPILIPNLSGKFLGWRPWLYTNQRKIKHATKVDGARKTGSRIKSWTSEFFIPYALLNPLQNVPAKAGTVWRANMYRVDHDHKRTATWSWKKVDGSFHQFEKFGWLIFK